MGRPINEHNNCNDYIINSYNIHEMVIKISGCITRIKIKRIKTMNFNKKGLKEVLKTWKNPFGVNYMGLIIGIIVVTFIIWISIQLLTKFSGIAETSKDTLFG